MKYLILFFSLALCSCSPKLIYRADIYLLNLNDKVVCTWDSVTVTGKYNNFLYFIDDRGENHCVSGNLVITNCSDSLFVK